jgi:hypothetical protein
MTKTEPAVAVYETHKDAEAAVVELQKANYDMKKLSIIGRDYHTEENVVGYYNNGDRMKYWGKLGAFWGGVWGLFFGAAFFWVPGIGQLLVGGPLVVSIVGALEGAVAFGGIDAIAAGLYGLGIPKDSVVRYQAALKASKFVVVAHGTPEEIARARRIMQGIAHV